MKEYFNAHAHTVGSLLDGYARPELYAERAKELNMTTVCATDHGNVHTLLDGYEAAQELGLKYMPGQEFYQARQSRFDRRPEERAGPGTSEWEQRGPYHLGILAYNNVGYNNLLKLSSRAYLEGFYVKPRIDPDLLAEHSEGLVVCSGCLASEVSQALLRDDYEFALKAAARIQDIVGKDNYFMEIQDHGLQEQKYVLPGTLQIAKTIGAKVIATCDSHYVHKEDAQNHDIALCVGTRATLDQEKRFRFNGSEHYLKSYDEMDRIFPWSNGECLDNTLLIAEKCEVNLSFGEFHFPDFPIPTNETPIQYLTRLAWEGAKRRYGELSDAVRERLEFELGVIDRMGFPNYFLVVADLVNWAKDNKIACGPGRGSAASSCVAYCLKITNLCPLRYGLLFERFLVEGRLSPPDIDLDFDSRYRDRVVDYARSKYGNDQVANICTFNVIGAKSAIRDATRVIYGDYELGDKLAKLCLPPVHGKPRTLSESMATTEMTKAYNTDPRAKEVLDAALGLEGIIRQTGIHAAGILISDKPITNYMPVTQKFKDGIAIGPMVTQWAMARAEQCGLLKIDCLALRNLDVIDECIKLIKARHGIEIDMHSIEPDDPAPYQLLQKGQTEGLFQCEGSGMTQLVVEMQPNKIEDIMALIALYRPGPMGTGMHRSYVERKHGRQKISYDHPALEPILNKTYGLMVYQEDILNIARQFAGFSAGDSADLQKSISKKVMAKVVKYKEQFIEGCKTTSNVNSTLANKIFSDIEYFAGYGFGLAHGASYGVLCYITTFLKYYYPTEYMAALLSSVTDTKDRMAGYLAECKRMNIVVRPPSINLSDKDFKIPDDNEILFGLNAIDGIGVAVTDAIVSSRTAPYKTIYDFFRRCDSVILNKGVIERLALSGALDELLPIQEQELSREDKKQILADERDLLGLYLTDHPLSEFWHKLKEDVTYEIGDVTTGSACLGGVITSITSLVTKRGDTMFRFILEDLTGSISAIIFPREAKSLVSFMEVGNIVLVDGNIEVEGDEESPVWKFVVKSIRQPSIDYDQLGEPINLSCRGRPNTCLLESINSIINRSPGNSIVYLNVKQDKLIVKLAFKTATDRSIIKDLSLIPGIEITS